MLHFHQVLWQGIHTSSNFAGHGNGVLGIGMLVLHSKEVNVTVLSILETLPSSSVIDLLTLLSTGLPFSYALINWNETHPHDQSTITVSTITTTPVKNYAMHNTLSNTLSKHLTTSEASPLH